MLLPLITAGPPGDDLADTLRHGVGDGVDDRPRLCQPVADYFYGFELVAQQLSRCVGHTERVLRGVKLGVLPEERTAYGDDVLSHTVYHALPFGDGFHLLLVGKVEDVLDGLLPVLGTLLDDACCDFFVVQTACDACASGVVAFCSVMMLS